MNRAFINRVKYNKWLYNLYFYCGSIVVRLLRLFVKQDKRKIVFSSFGGRKYDDSPRCIFEAMKKDSRFCEYKYVWAFGNPEQFEIPGATKVKCDTFEYYKELLSAMVWVTNSTMERGLSFKPKHILNLNSWHGSAIKVMGVDVNKENTSFQAKGRKPQNDIMLAQGQYDVDVFSRVFGLPKENFRIIGLPRNDDLVNCNTEERRKSIREKLGISNDKRVILYAPTFREYDKDANSNCVMNLPVDWIKWEKSLGNEYILLVRAHYEVVKQMQIKDNAFIRDVSSYPNLNDLMIVSDLLVSDYSSIFFDYSIQDKPMLCFTYDYEKYAALRGMYFDIRERLDCYCNNEDEIIYAINNLDLNKRVDITRAFRKYYIEKAGNASKESVGIIWDFLNENRYKNEKNNSCCNSSAVVGCLL